MIDGTNYMTVREAAEYRGVPVVNVKTAILRGKLPAHKDERIGRVFLLPADVDAWQISTHGGKRENAGRKKKEATDG